MGRSSSFFTFNFKLMKRFLKLSLLFIISFFILDKLFFIFLAVSPSLEVDKRLEKVLKGKVNEELVIIGSSTGARNIIASQIEDSLGLSAYNLSYPGSDVEFHHFVLETLLKYNTPPKIVIMTVDQKKELQENNSINFRLDRLYPLSKYEYVNKELVERGEKNILSKFFVLARLNRGNFDLEKERFSALDTIYEDGSMPISFSSQKENFRKTIDTSYNRALEAPNKVKAFLNIQELCEKNDISLIIVFPPYYKSRNLAFERRIKSLSRPETIFYSYNKKNPIYKNKNFYYDMGHLKKNGAVIFTNEIIKELKEDFL